MRNGLRIHCPPDSKEKAERENRAVREHCSCETLEMCKEYHCECSGCRCNGS